MRTNLTTKDEVETLSDFAAKIDHATIEGLEWVETSPKIINYYVRAGMGAAEFFIYKNIKVCEYGQSERLQDKMGKQLGQLVHGDARVNQVERTRQVAGT